MIFGIGELDIVKAIVEHGANINASDISECNSVHRAAVRGILLGLVNKF